MRILVADQNALLLAVITATFGKHCDLVTATRRDVCISYVEQQKFDVVVACDKMADYTGLELLSEIAALSPGTLLIFAASPERLERLSYRLQVFGLLDTLAYPITPRKLLNALRHAREYLPSRAARKVRHVVLQSEWDTGERLALVEKELDAAIARHSSGIGETDWESPPATEPPAAPARSGGGDAGSLGTAGGIEEFVFANSPADEIPQLPTTQEHSWEVSEYDGFVYEPASAAVAAEIEVMPAEVPVTQAGDPIEQVEYEAVSNDPTLDAAEPLSWEDGAANDGEFGAESTGAADHGTGGGQTLSAILTSGGSWSVSPPPVLSYDDNHGIDDDGDASSSEPAPQISAAWLPSEPAPELSSAPSPVATTDSTAAPATPAPAAAATPATAGPGSVAAAAETTDSKGAAKRQSQPRRRRQADPTDAQRAAFERARARRNAEREGANKADSKNGASRRGHKKGHAAETPSAGSAAASNTFAAPAGSGESKSLSSLARIATTKQPLKATAPGKPVVPKRAVFAVGSGLAAAI